MKVISPNTCNMALKTLPLPLWDLACHFALKICWTAPQSVQGLCWGSPVVMVTSPFLTLGLKDSLYSTADCTVVVFWFTWSNGNESWLLALNTCLTAPQTVQWLYYGSLWVMVTSPYLALGLEDLPDSATACSVVVLSSSCSCSAERPNGLHASPPTAGLEHNRLVSAVGPVGGRPV